jgi:hypothetical protein
MGPEQALMLPGWGKRVKSETVPPETVGGCMMAEELQMHGRDPRRKEDGSMMAAWILLATAGKLQGKGNGWDR